MNRPDPPSQAAALEQLRLQGQASGAIGSLSLAPSSLLSPAPSGGGLHLAQQHSDAGALQQGLSQGLSQGFAQSAQLPANVAALSTLARLACSGGLAGLTAAATGAANTLPSAPLAQQAFAGHAVHPVAGDEHTATNVPDGRPATMQARLDPLPGLPQPCDV